MARRSYTPERIISKLREAEVLLSQGSTVGEAARKAQGRAFRILTVIDEYTRERLAILFSASDCFPGRYRAVVLSVCIQGYL